MMLDDFVGFNITKCENWADAIIAAGLPTDIEEWRICAEEAGIDSELLDETDFAMVEQMLEERSRW